MKKLSFPLFLFIIIIIVGFNSCTIKKRLYQPGYHVEWHKINKESKTTQGKESLLSNDLSIEEIDVKNQENIIEEPNHADDAQEFEPVYASNDENINNTEFVTAFSQERPFKTYNKKETTICHESKNKEKNIKISYLTKAERPGKIHWTAILGLSLCVLSLALVFLPALPSANLGLLIFSMLGTFIFITAGFIFSLIALYVILKNPEIYKGIGLAIAGIIIGLLLWCYIFIIIAL